MARGTRSTTDAAKYLDPVDAVVRLVRLFVEYTVATVDLYRATPQDKLATIFAGYSPKALSRIANMAKRWGNDEDAAPAWVHQTFPATLYPVNGPEAEKFPALANISTLYNALRDQGTIAPDAPGWVDVCRLGVERGVLVQEKAGFITGGKWRPGYKIAVKADYEAIRARLKARREAGQDASSSSSIPDMRKVLGL